jgi:hypothetical protein
MQARADSFHLFDLVDTETVTSILIRHMRKERLGNGILIFVGQFARLFDGLLKQFGHTPYPYRHNLRSVPDQRDSHTARSRLPVKIQA